MENKTDDGMKEAITCEWMTPEESITELLSKLRKPESLYLCSARKSDPTIYHFPKVDLSCQSSLAELRLPAYCLSAPLCPILTLPPTLERLYMEERPWVLYKHDLLLEQLRTHIKKEKCLSFISLRTETWEHRANKLIADIKDEGVQLEIRFQLPWNRSGILV